MLPDVWLTKDECDFVAKFIWFWRVYFPVELVLRGLSIVRHSYEEYKTVENFVVAVQMFDVDAENFYRHRRQFLEIIEGAIRRAHTCPLPASLL